jgi:capsular exopolysaccharide synthesis family protein
MEDQVQIKNPESANLSIKDIFFKYIRFLPLFVISVALSLLVAYVYLRYITPIYRATGSLIIKNDQPLKGSEKFDQVFTSDNTNNIQNEIEVLKSRPLMERVVKALDLNFTYYAKGKIKEMDVYKTCPFYVEAFEIADSSNPFNLIINFVNSSSFTVNGGKNQFTMGQVFRNEYGVFRLMRRNFDALNNIYRINWAPTYSIASALANALQVSPKSQGTGILVLQLDADNPQLTAEVINQTMKEYQDLTLEDKNATNLRSKAFIDDRLKVVSHELDSINSRRLAFMRENNIVDPEAQSTSYLNSITETDKGINQQRTQLEIAQMIDNYLSNKQNSFDPVPSTLGIADPTLNTMIAAYNVAQLEHKSLIDGNVPKGNVLVKEKEDQIEKLRENILENLRNIKSSLNTSLQNLQQQNNSSLTQIKTLPAKQQVLEDIKRQQASKLAVYNYLMEKQEETAIALASNITSSKTLDQAVANSVPVSPNKRSIQLIAIFIGILLPALFIFVLELLNDKVTTRHDIERLTAATIIGEVGHAHGKDTLVVKNNNRGVVAEQFRIIRSNLQYVLNNIQKPVVLVTSSFSGEGKSFVSTNTGAVMALAGKKTIILEFDIRKPKVLSQLHMSKKPGLTNYLLGKISVEQLPVPVEGNEFLYVLPCGPVPPNPAELLLDPKLNDLFVYLRQNFDVIVMDTAPIGMVSDALTLSKFADCTLYIVRQGHTYKKQIGLVDEFYREGKLPKISIVLNDIKLHAGYGYYGYGRYGYGHGYGYGSGYFDDEEMPPTMLNKWFGWLDIKKWNHKKTKRTKV